MKELKAKSQLKIGTKLKIVGHSESDNYGSISVKKLIECESNDGRKWTEVLINRSKNYYFHLEYYLAGKSLWVKEVFVLSGTDRRLKGKS